MLAGNREAPFGVERELGHAAKDGARRTDWIQLLPVPPRSLPPAERDSEYLCTWIRLCPVGSPRKFPLAPTFYHPSATIKEQNRRGQLISVSEQQLNDCRVSKNSLLLINNYLRAIVNVMWEMRSIPAAQWAYDRSARWFLHAKTLFSGHSAEVRRILESGVPGKPARSLPKGLASRQSASSPPAPFMPMGLRRQVLVSNVYNGLEQSAPQRAGARADQ